MNYKVLIVHGGIGSGKTRRAQQITDRAKVNGYNVYGIISKRVMKNRETVGYDGIDLQTGKMFPMVYKDTEVQGEDWKQLRGPFLYSKKAFSKANKLLRDAAYRLDDGTLVVVDEFGHLEAVGFGIYPGLSVVVEALKAKGKLLLLCRTDKIDTVLRLFAGEEAKILVMDAGQPNFLESLADCFI